MDWEIYEKTLEKQLQLLSERSEDKTLTPVELCELTKAMTSIVDVIHRRYGF